MKRIISSESPACMTEGWLLQNITAQLNQCHEKMNQHPLWREDYVKLAYMAVKKPLLKK